MKTDEKRYFVGIMASALLIAGVMSGCGKEPAASQPVDSSSESPVSSAPVEPEVFNFAGAEMGMTIEEAQAVLGKNDVQKRDGKSYMAYVFEELPGLKKGAEKTAVFVFDTEGKMEEVQYIVEKADGVAYQDMVTAFADYGPHAEVTEDGLKTSIWMFKGTYFTITQMDSERYAVSYYEKNSFEKDFPEEATAYQQLGQ